MAQGRRGRTGAALTRHLEDFEKSFAALGLAKLDGDASLDKTFTSGEQLDTTLHKGPAHDGTLPRLMLETPDAVRDGGDDSELVVVDILGEGGMGQVLLARQHSLGREVAVKVLKPGPTSTAASDALVEEARTTGSLEHPGVVPVYALARDSRGLPALVMKRVDGVSWRALLLSDQHPGWERIARGPDRLEANLEVLIQVCNAIAHAHQRGVIHRDIKPANVLVGELGEVYLADWGIASQKARLRPGPPRLVGTPAYLAPEMVTGDPTLTDERTDIYLLGGTLYEVLTRKPPHAGDSIHEVMQNAWVAAPPTLPREVPAELAAVCSRALAADPRDRFPTALELRDALRVFLQHRGSIHLANAAAARLKKLEAMATSPLAAGEERGWYALISECRFGFTQALEADPQSALALTCLERCLEVATVRELERGAAGAARAFFAEMKSRPPAIESALQALEAKDAERALRDQRHLQDAHETNPSVSLRQRNLVVAMIGIASVALVTALSPATKLREQLEGWLGEAARLVPMGVLCVVFVVSVIVGRKALLATRINRQLMALIGIGVFSMEIGRVQFLLMGLSLQVSLVHDALMIATMLVACGFILHWGFAVTGAIFFATAISVALTPERHGVTVFSVMALFALLVSSWMVIPWQRKLARAQQK